MESQSLRISDSALERMSSEDLNMRLAEITFNTQQGCGNWAERRKILSILSQRGLR